MVDDGFSHHPFISAPGEEDEDVVDGRADAGGQVRVRKDKALPRGILVVRPGEDTIDIVDLSETGGPVNKVFDGGYTTTTLRSSLIGAATSARQVAILRAARLDRSGPRVPTRNALPADIVPTAAYGRAYGFERAMEDRTVRRRCGSPARVPPTRRATPARASETPSMMPRAAAGGRSVEASRVGSSAVGTSWPTSASRLAVPMPATPGLNQPLCRVASSCSGTVTVRQSVRDRWATGLERTHGHRCT
jgi:hypothetical protein